MRNFLPFGIAAGFLAAGLAAAGQSAGPHPWQVLQMPTAEQVKQAWVSPPSEYGPEPYYGMNGPVTLEVVQHDLDTMHSLGFRAVTVQWGAGSGRDYLSPEYFAFFKQFVAEAKKRDMRMWIVDDAGYPSGFAGGKITAEHPELRMQALVARKVPVSAGAALDEAVSGDTVAVTAISDSGETKQVPMKDGHAHWQVPSSSSSGSWTVYVVEHAFRTSPTKSDTNPKHVKDGSQSLEDYLDPAATAQYLEYTHEAYRKAVGDEFGKTLLGFRGDEPDYSISGLPWTPKFFAAFQAKKGYDIRPFVATFLQGKDAKLPEEQLRAKADYYDVFADLFRDGFFKPQADWCAKNGLEYQVHLNHEEQQLLLAHSEGDFFRDMRYVQVPGIDSIWHQIWTDTVSDFPRFASSAAHVYGHPRAFTETFAAYRPEPDITMARYILNEQFVRGVNLVEMMYYPSSATPGRGGPAKFMRDPDFPALAEYTRRLSYLMSMGRPDASVALLLPAESLWMGDAKADDMFVSTERALSEHQIDFDIVDEDAIGSVLKLDAGAFESLSGNRYRTVLVPCAELLPGAVVSRLREFAAKGGRVVFLGATPSRIGGKTDKDARVAREKDFAWAKIVPVSLDAVPVPPQQPPAAAPAPLTVPAELLEAVRPARAVSPLYVEGMDPAVRFTSRNLKDATVMLMFNEGPKELTHEIGFLPKNRVEVWDPQTGKATPAQMKGNSAVVRMPAYGTVVLVVK